MLGWKGLSCEVTKENFQKSRKIIIVAFATFLYPPIFDISIQKRIFCQLIHLTYYLLTLKLP